jgi:hypothetical protein
MESMPGGNETFLALGYMAVRLSCKAYPVEYPLYRFGYIRHNLKLLAAHP